MFGMFREMKYFHDKHVKYRCNEAYMRIDRQRYIKNYSSTVFACIIQYLKALNDKITVH